MSEREKEREGKRERVRGREGERERERERERVRERERRERESPNTVNLMIYLHFCSYQASTIFCHRGKIITSKWLNSFWETRGSGKSRREKKIN